MRALILTLCTLLALALSPPAPAHGAQARPGGAPWIGANPYGFLVGDSIAEQCHEDFGVGWRSLGFVGWPGASTRTMRQRLTATDEGWPYTTEPSNAIERQWFRDAGWLVIALGTNNGWTGVPIDETRDDIDWFMTQAHGRPVLWFDVRQTGELVDEAAAMNAELAAATDRYPNLKVLPWYQWTAENADELIDGVHVRTFERGCELGRNRLIRHGAPAEDAAHDSPLGYWYPSTVTTGPVALTGWGAGYTPQQREYVSLNLRSDYGHVARWAITAEPVDVWAVAAGARAFRQTVGPEFRGHLLCLDLIDAAGQWTSLGCRTP